LELLLYQNLRAYTIIASLSLLDEHLYFHTWKGIMKKQRKPKQPVRVLLVPHLVSLML